MSFSVNTNITSLQAQNYLRQTSNFQNTTINRVTSGLRIVQSGDDAAGLAIANGLRSDQAVLTQGIRNANDGLSNLQTVDGGMSNISTLLDRARTLASQSASGTFTGDRTVLNSEFQSVIGEIDRQAQSIGMNTGGSLAKSLAVFIGGGQGSTSGAAIQNGSVGLDLSKATVDTKSLGLSTYQATNASSADLSSASSTSVAKIVASALSATGLNVTTATFDFAGAGFGDVGGAGTAGQKVGVTISLTGLTDTAGLATAINQAIYNAANPTTGATDQSRAFKAAGITANVITDSSGHETLGFSSSNAAFQVSAGDQTAGSFLGNIADSRSGKIAGEGAMVATATTALATHDYQADAAFVGAATVTFAGTGLGNGNPIILASLTNAVSGSLTAQQAVDAINTDIAASGYRAELKDGKVALFSKDGSEFTATFSAAAGTGLGFAADTVSNATYKALNSGGVYMSSQGASSGANTDYSNSAYMFQGLAGGETQTLTISTQHPDSTAIALNVTIGGAGATDVTKAINQINDALQASKDASLQNIVAVRDQNGIRFMSTNSFAVGLGSTSANWSNGATQGDGLTEKVDTNFIQAGTTLDATVQGASGSADISTQSAASAAVTAIADAVSTLGKAQAVVGKGENQLNYAVNLAQSQVTNEASAESRIRDADLASEAANLTKAQILMQAGVAALAQANSAPQQILSLLKG